MKILLWVPEYPPNHIGWWGIVFENLYKAYTELWHEVLVISWDHTQKNIFLPLKIKQLDSWNIVKIPEIFTPLSLLHTVMPYPFWYTKRIKQIIEDFNPDFIHIHGYWLFMPAQLAKICRALKLDYTFTIHGAPVSPEKMKNPIISWVYNFYNTYYWYPMLDWAKSITAVSQYAKDFQIFSNYTKNIQIIWNGINPREYKKVGENIFEQKWIWKNEKSLIILSLWRIEWIKWFDKIIKLLPDMIQKWYNVEYVIAWRDNGEKESLVELATELWVSERVHYLGFIENNHKMSALTHCDIVAIPSETESYWLVALEARKFLKPIITTFAGWLKDALKWYDFAYTLDEYEKSFWVDEVIDTNISNFYWWEIANKYILTK